MTELARASYYRTPIREERQLKHDLELKAVIEDIHSELPGYGYRRVREHLLREGKVVNSKRIKRVMRKYGIFSCIKKINYIPI